MNEHTIYYLDMVSMVSGWSAPEPFHILRHCAYRAQPAVCMAERRWADGGFDHVRVLRISISVAHLEPPTATAEVIWADGQEVTGNE